MQTQKLYYEDSFIKEFEALNPFEILDDIMDESDEVVHIVDFHAEANGEKKSLGYYFDGRISAVIGTHTHVQTNDARVLDKKTLKTNKRGK